MLQFLLHFQRDRKILPQKTHHRGASSSTCSEMQDVALTVLTAHENRYQSTATSKGSVSIQGILTSINLFTSSHHGAPQLTTGEKEMEFSVDFLVSDIDGKGIKGVLSFPLHHWQINLRLEEGLNHPQKHHPGLTKSRTGLSRTAEERSRPLACQVRLKHPSASVMLQSGKMRQKYLKYGTKMDEINWDKNNAGFRC